MILELIEKRRRLHEDNVAELQKAKADGRDTLDPEAEERWQNRDAAIESLTKNIEMRKKQERIEAALAEAEERKAEPNPIATERRTSQAGQQQLRQSKYDFEMAMRGWFLQPTATG
jgi:hypothetical protein